MTSSPLTESGVPTNCSSELRPLASRVMVPSAITARAIDVPIHTVRGRWLIAQPVLAQNPVDVGSWLPSTGLTGQKIQRPMITSSAGSRLIIASRTTPTPMASTGPMLCVEFISATRRQSMPMMTVELLAMIAGPARCSASSIASCRSWCRRNSSR
jgi:hypothetical protein